MAVAGRHRVGAVLGSSRRVHRLLVVALGAPLIGLIGVTLAETVPDGRIAAHLTEAMGRGELTVEDRTISMLGTTADHYGECTAVMVGLGDRPGNLVRRALFSSASYGCVPAIRELEAFAATGELPVQPDYMRYWHGYAVFTRPALAVFGLTGTRWLSFAILGLAIGGFARALFLRFGWIAPLVAVAPGLLTTDMIVGGFSITHAIGLATAWLGGWLVFQQVSRDPSWRMAALAAALGAAVNAYFDLMVAIPASLALCVVAAGLGRQRAGLRLDTGATATSMLAAVGGWVTGLGAMWASKWVFAWLLVDRQRIVDSVRDQIAFRTGGEYDGVTGTRFTGLTKNVTTWIDQPLTPLVAGATLALLATLAWREYRSAPAPPDWRWIAGVGGCLAIVAVPFAGWYIALDNHNQIHFWLTYRSVAIAFGALASFVAVAVSHARRGEPTEPSRWVVPSGTARPATDHAKAFEISAGASAPRSVRSFASGVDEAITSEPSEERDTGPR